MIFGLKQAEACILVVMRAHDPNTGKSGAFGLAKSNKYTWRPRVENDFEWNAKMVLNITATSIHSSY